MQKKTFWVEGTTCRSCEIAIEKAWKHIPGVQSVQVDGATGDAVVTSEAECPSRQTLERSLGGMHYKVHEVGEKPPAKRPSWQQLLGVFSLVLGLWWVLSSLGMFQSHVSFGAGLGFASVFVIGLVAGSSSCVAVVGGLLISSAARFNQRYNSVGPIARMRPVVFFVLGRIIGYTVLGGLIGVVGSILTPSPLVTALITMVAAVYMIIMGLDMLHIAPRFLKKLLPRVSKKMSHGILGADSKEHWVMPFVLGAATFFLPCGFTQALQLYALTVHSFGAAALLLLAFSLGTAPALLVLGFVGGSLRGKVGQWFFMFSGALVIVLALWNISNALALTGISAPSSTAGAVVPMQNGQQIVEMKVGVLGYTPNHFTVKAGVPVKWVIQGTNQMGCAAVLVSRTLGVQKFLSPGQNIITFRPLTPGEIAFSCSMGMYRGSFTVVP